jgi:hypothetical protein
MGRHGLEPLAEHAPAHVLSWDREAKLEVRAAGDAVARAPARARKRRRKVCRA